MQPSQVNYQSGSSGGNPQTVGHCAVCNRPIAHGQTYYYCRACGRGPLCNNHFYGDSGCAFCKGRKGFPGWATALIVIAVLLIGGGAFLVVDPLGLIDGRGTPSYVAPSPTYYSLSTSVSPSGSGTISPPSQSVKAGTTVSLRAQPNSGYVFDHWGGNASGSSGSTSVTMNSNKSVIAYFTPKSPTPVWDTTPPTISNVSASTTETSATVTWRTDELSSSQVEYGKTANYGTSSGVYNDPNSADSIGVLPHSVVLTDLDPETTYYYKIKSKDAVGNAGESIGKTFTTTGSSTASAPSLPSYGNTSILEFPDEVVRGDYMTIRVKPIVFGKCFLDMGKVDGGGWISNITCHTDQYNIALFHVKIPETFEAGVYRIRIDIVPYEKLDDPHHIVFRDGEESYGLVFRNIIVKED